MSKRAVSHTEETEDSRLLEQHTGREELVMEQQGRREMWLLLPCLSFKAVHSGMQFKRERGATNNNALTTGQVVLVLGTVPGTHYRRKLISYGGTWYQVLGIDYSNVLCP